MVDERVLVVDDDPAIVKILRGYLEQASYQVLSAHDGNTAMSLLRREKPDLLILDLMLPDRDGWEITRLIRADGELGTMPILMLTARVDDTDKIVGLELGADDYVTKPFNAREVVARVRALLRRSRMGSAAPSVLRYRDLKLDLGERSLYVRSEPVQLTPTEFGILQMLMEHVGYTCTREEILERAVGYSYEGMGRTLDTHIRNLRRKIDPDPDNPEYIHTVYGVGYRLARSEK